MNYKTRGIVIKRSDFSESDRILTIFTERFGKVKAIARGVRKVSSKLAGSLEPFMLLGLMLYEGKTFYTVTGVVIEAEYPKVHTVLKKMAGAFYIGELIDKFEEEKQKSEVVFQLIIEALGALNKYDSELVLRVFEVLILNTAGVWGDLSICLHCHRKLEPVENFWDGEEGGIICHSCQRTYHHGLAMSNDAIKVFRLIISDGFNIINRLKIPEEIKEELNDILSIYLRRVLESDIKSEKFIKEL
jgi:DNA repair protein RecO (recombination protein O)